MGVLLVVGVVSASFSHWDNADSIGQIAGVKFDKETKRQHGLVAVGRIVIFDGCFTTDCDLCVVAMDG